MYIHISVCECVCIYNSESGYRLFPAPCKTPLVPRSLLFWPLYHEFVLLVFIFTEMDFYTVDLFIPGFSYSTLTHVACVVVCSFDCCAVLCFMTMPRTACLSPRKPTLRQISIQYCSWEVPLGWQVGQGETRSRVGNREMSSVWADPGPPQLTPQGAWKLECPGLDVGLPWEWQPWQSGSLQPRQIWKDQQPDGCLLAAFPTAGASPTLKKDLGTHNKVHILI